jgi:hypothetical protein
MPMFIDLKHWNLGFGQTKLPVTVSSKLIGGLQLTDRSINNAKLRSMSFGLHNMNEFKIHSLTT